MKNTSGGSEQDQSVSCKSLGKQNILCAAVALLNLHPQVVVKWSWLLGFVSTQIEYCS